MGRAAKTHPEPKCPELLTNYCDLLLQKTPLSKKIMSEEIYKSSIIHFSMYIQSICYIGEDLLAYLLAGKYSMPTTICGMRRKVSLLDRALDQLQKLPDDSLTSCAIYCQHYDTIDITFLYFYRIQSGGSGPKGDWRPFSVQASICTDPNRTNCLHGSLSTRPSRHKIT